MKMLILEAHSEYPIYGKIQRLSNSQQVNEHPYHGTDETGDDDEEEEMSSTVRCRQ